MKKVIYLLSIALILGACGHKETKKEIGVIQVEEKIESPTEIHASDFLKEIRYVPLETSDSMMIGASPFVRFYKDYAIVSGRNTPCMVFDKNTGKYIRTIGSINKGPQGYRSSDGFWVNGQTGVIYLNGWGKNYLKFSIDGEYLGTVTYPNGVTTVCNLGENLLLGYSNGAFALVDDIVVYFNEQDSVVKHFPAPLMEQDSVGVNDIASISVLRQGEEWGEAARGGVLIMIMKNPEKSQISFMNQPVFWHLNGTTYFKESFNDTIYRVTLDSLIPDRNFNLGKYHWEYKDKLLADKRKAHTTIDLVMENEHFLFFEYTIGMDKRVAYTGMLDKQKNEVKTTKYKEGIVDDINDFMPLHILQITADNQMVGCVQPLDIHAWLENNPDKALTPELTKLKGLKEDDNPVLVIMESK